VTGSPRAFLALFPSFLRLFSAKREECGAAVTLQGDPAISPALSGPRSRSALGFFGRSFDASADNPLAQSLMEMQKNIYETSDSWKVTGAAVK